jgi:hypothetical protein
MPLICAAVPVEASVILSMVLLLIMDGDPEEIPDKSLNLHLRWQVRIVLLCYADCDYAADETDKLFIPECSR